MEQHLSSQLQKILESTFETYIGPTTKMNLGEIVTAQNEKRQYGTIDLEGSVVVEGDIRVDHIRAQKIVYVAREAKVTGDIYAGYVIVIGQVKGDIYATSGVQVCATGDVDGDIRTGKIIMDNGCTINGIVETSRQTDLLHKILSEKELMAPMVEKK